MHLTLGLLTLIVICLWRWQWQRSVSCGRYHLAQFLLPVLAFGGLAIAVFSMATEGLMLGIAIHGGWVARWLIGTIAAASLIHLLYLCGCGWRAGQKLKQLELVDFFDTKARLLPTPLPFAAQVGFWRSQLVVSTGLLERLSPAQLEAVFYHEQGHGLNHDCLWFFGLGWLRQITSWLPHTLAIWQRLLLERELQADRYACQFVDPLTLAEALLQVVSYRGEDLSPLAQVGGSDRPDDSLDDPLGSRLEIRVQQLLDLRTNSSAQRSPASFTWLCLLLSAALPLVWIPLHQI
ncbi:MAG: M56 family metallopeptidase [Pseudanabaenaceae cyanobacterium bins.68]|nr:M56 family metallopeptidase [Pseudanabaenaceae cyanobacterium bins.68]